MHWRKEEQNWKPRESGLTEQEPQVLMGLTDAGVLFGIRILPSSSDQITLLPPQQEGFVETYPVPGLAMVAQALCSIRTPPHSKG